MAGTREGGLKAYQTRIKKDPDFYKKLGEMGGSAPYKGKKGFASMSPEKRSEAGRLGGAKSRRGKA